MLNIPEEIVNDIEVFDLIELIEQYNPNADKLDTI
jgi:hypothetical protein